MELQETSYASRLVHLGILKTTFSFGDYLGASLTIADVNRDGKMDFFVPTRLLLLDLQDSKCTEPNILLVDNLRSKYSRDHS